MPTATAALPRSAASSFALRGLAWGLGLFGVLRLPWIEVHAVLPLTALQGRVAAAATGGLPLPVDVGLACSGTDVLAMCLGAVLAYPARWRMRLAGAAGGIALVLTLNILRIGSLGRTAGSPALFDVLHLYAWPAALALGVAAYVFLWMRMADGARFAAAPAAGAAGAASVEPAASAPRMTPQTRRFVLLAAALIVAFAATAPWYAGSAWVAAVAGFIASGAAAALRFTGLTAVASGAVLSTARGGFLVTEECIMTPLIPVYLAAVLAYGRTWRVRVPALAAAVPLFVALGMLRLLVVAAPAALVESPLFFVHAFYQLLTAAVVVCIAAIWQHRVPVARWRAALGVAAGAVSLYLLAPLAAWALAAAPPFEDAQGALALLPAFQIALLAALWITVSAPGHWRLFAIGAGLLALSHAALFAALQTPALAVLATHVSGIRAWSLAAPIAVTAAIGMYAPPRR